MKYKAVLFDFDYTLGDSTIPITVGYQQGFIAMGLPVPSIQEVRPTIGMTLMDGYTHLTGDADKGRRRAFREHFMNTVGQRAVERGKRIMIYETRLLPGAVELLTALRERGVLSGIVSTKMRATIRDILAYRQLEHLPAIIVGGEDVTRAKPDPEGLLAAMEKLGVRAEETLFCGDTVIDALTAQAAGTDFCAVLNGSTPAGAFDPLPSVHIAPGLRELQEWLGL